jgi:hypothetical protein
VAFAWWQTRAAHPLLPLRVILERNRGGSFLAMFITGIGMFGVFLFLTYYLQEILRYSPVMTGLAFLPLVGALMVTATISHHAALPAVRREDPGLRGHGDRGGRHGLAHRDHPTSTYAANILGPLLMIGFGMGAIFAPAMNAATSGVEERDAGVASAMVNTSQQIGGSIGTALLNSLAASALTAYLVGKNAEPARAGRRGDPQLHRRLLVGRRDLRRRRGRLRSDPAAGQAGPGRPERDAGRHA